MILPRALLRNRGYAFGLLLSLSGHNFGPFARLRHFQGLEWLLKDRFRKNKNRLYRLADCSNHVKAVETALFVLSGHNFGPFARLRHFQGLVWLLRDRIRKKQAVYARRLQQPRQSCSKRHFLPRVLLRNRGYAFGLRD